MTHTPATNLQPRSRAARLSPPPGPGGSAAGGFTLLVVILVLALMTVLGVGLLAMARTEIVTSGLTSQRVRAEVAARGGLEEALDLLRFHTRHGNYVTAMQPLTARPQDQTVVIQELYRPYWDSGDDLAARTSRYLAADDPNRPIVADYLVSLSDGFGNPDQRSEPRPPPWALSNDPAASPGGNRSEVALGMPYRDPSQQASHGSGQPWPLFTDSNSYNFNRQVGPVEEARFLVYPATDLSGPAPVSLPAPGQWIHLRDDAGRVTARYAWFIEDESMKLNVNTTGVDERPSDLLADPLPNAVRGIDPGSALPAPGNRDDARQQAIAAGDHHHRALTPGSVPLFGEAWNQSGPVNGPAAWMNFITTVSATDDTTGRGWPRMNLNQVVTSNPPADAARLIADWIRDAWTGPTGIDSLQDHQLFGNERLRLQLAANIVDYIDDDNLPTDLGEVEGYPVIGIEKIPYLIAVEPRFEHLDLGDAATPGFRRSQITLRANLRFYNLFDEPLDLADSVQSVLLTGLPILIRGGQDVLDIEEETFEIRIPEDLENNDTVIPAPQNGVGTSGARTFSTAVLGQWTVDYPIIGQTSFLAGLLEIEVLGEDYARLDVTEVGLNSRSAQWAQSGTGRFLFDDGSSGREAAVICLHFTIVPTASGSTPREIGDPRFRPEILNGRWYHTTRSDQARVEYGLNRAEQNSRAFSVDWYQHFGNAPKAIHRNSPMRSIGELGHVAACEFPWRTLYLQHPERPANTTEFYFANAIPERRLASLDWVLTDLFTVGGQRAGQWNVNSQLLGFAGNTVSHGGAHGLFRRMEVGGPHGHPLVINDALASALADVVTGRRLNPVPTDRNAPPRPFLQRGQLAAPLSRAVGFSDGTTTNSRSVVSASIYGPTGNNTPLAAIDAHMEQPFRQVASAVTTGGTVFRVLFVGQAVTDRNNDGIIQPSEVRAEYLAEALVERVPVIEEVPGQPGPRTVDAVFNVISQRAILE